MRRARPLLALAGVLLLPLVAGGASIEGRITHAQRAGAGAKLRVDLLGVKRGGETITRHTRADREGRYRFTGLPEPAVYLVMATYQEIRFPGGRAAFEDGSAPTQTVDVPIYEQSHDPAGVRIEQLGWTIEPTEAGSYRVEQRARIHNPRQAAILAKPGAPPILRIGMAPGHGDLVSPFGGVPDGFVVNNGLLELRGPLLSGQRDVAFGYELAPPGSDLAVEIAIPDAVGEFALFVRDVGLRVDAGALYPGRPARDDDGQAFQRYLGFELPAGLRLPLRIAVPGPRTPQAPAALALAAAALTLAVALFVFAPLARSRPAPEAVEAEPASAGREALYRALRELEHDYETGKVSAEDRERMRQEMIREVASELEPRGGTGPV